MRHLAPRTFFTFQIRAGGRAGPQPSGPRAGMPGPMAIYMGIGRAREPKPEPEPPPDCARELRQGDSCLSELFSTA